MNESQAELLLVGVVVLLAGLCPQFGATVHRWTWKHLEHWVKRPARFLAITSLAALVGSALFAALVLWPQPSAHDEFCYLLAADTFASGRLTNPTHPFWQHFETFHTIHQPTYMAKYPPGQGLSLAIGQAIVGDATPSLWLQAAGMCAAIGWMLFGWLPRRWAVAGTLLVLARFGIQSYWVQTFWGGAVAAIGGALVYGALPRVLRRPKASFGLVLAAGLLVLANSRPFEGAVASLPPAALLLFWGIRRTRIGKFREVVRVAVPMLALLLVGAVWMAHYNATVTGDPFRLPYSVYDASYSTYPNFLWQDRKELPPYRHDFLRSFALSYQAGDYERVRQGVEHYLHVLLVERWWLLAKFFFGMLLLPLAALPFGRRRPGQRVAVLAFGVGLLATCGTCFCDNHYVAPLTGLFILLAVLGWRSMADLQSSPRLSQGMQQRALALSGGLTLAVVAFIPIKTVWFPANDSRFFGHAHRGQLLRKLEEVAGKDLVFVRHEGEPKTHYDFVFNAADIDRSPVIWARDMGLAANRKLMGRYPRRFVWSLTWRGFSHPPKVRRIRNPLR